MFSQTLGVNGAIIHIILIFLILFIGGIVSYACVTMADSVQQDVIDQVNSQSSIINKRTDIQRQFIDSQENAIDNLSETVKKLDLSIDKLVAIESRARLLVINDENKASASIPSTKDIDLSSYQAHL